MIVEGEFGLNCSFVAVNELGPSLQQFESRDLLADALGL
jgi:hypothetical protein